MLRGDDHWLPVMRYPASWAVNAAPGCFFSGVTPDPHGVLACGHSGRLPPALRCFQRSEVAGDRAGGGAGGGLGLVESFHGRIQQCIGGNITILRPPLMSRQTTGGQDVDTDIKKGQEAAENKRLLQHVAEACQMVQNKLLRPAGLEPATSWFEGS